MGHARAGESDARVDDGDHDGRRLEGEGKASIVEGLSGCAAS